MARPCERGVALEVDGEQVCSPVAAEAEAGKGGGVCVWIGLRQWAEVPEDQTPVEVAAV